MCIGSIDELEKLSGVRITDLHREKLADIVKIAIIVLCILK